MNEVINTNKGIRDGTDMIFDNKSNNGNDLSSDTILLSNLTVYENIEWKEEKVNNNINNIPKDWKNTILDKMFVKIKGIKSIKNNNLKLPIISADSLKNYNYKDYANDGKIINKNEIIILWDGENAGKVGFKHYGYLSSTSAKLTNKNNGIINTTYAFKQLEKNEFLLKLKREGSTIPHMNKDLMNIFSLIHPVLLAEQNKIRELLTKQENIIENIDKRIEKTKKIIKYYQQELLSGRLRLREVETINGKEIVVYENTEWKEEKINGRVVVIPEDFIIYKLKNIANFKPGYAFKEKQITKQITNFKLLKIGNIDFNGKYKKISNNQFYLFERNDDFKLFENDLILAMDDLTPSATFIGTTCIVKDNNNYLNQRIGVFRNLTINYKFLHYFLNQHQENFKKIATGSTAKNLSKKTIENIEIYLSNKKEEQILIRDFLTKLDDNLENLQNLKNKEEKTFKFLQQEFLSGKLRLK